MLGALMGGLLVAASVHAEPLTCATFKDRLSGALVASGDPDTEMPSFTGGRAMADHGSHNNWTTAALSGSLTCGADDRFQEFYVSLNVAGREQFAGQLKRLVTLDGAAICTLATASPSTCTEVGKALLQVALEQMGIGFKRRVSNPSGLSNRMPWPDVRTEVTAAPTLITFSLATNGDAAVETGRRPLSPPAAPQPAP